MESKTPLQIFLSLILLLGLSGHVSAVVMENLYTVVIQVTDNTLQARNRELPAAFAQVVQRAASSNDVLKSPQYENAREHLDRFVSNYFYTDNGDGTYTLTLRFNEQMINNLLSKIGRTALGVQRPQVLLWLVVEQNQQTNFITHGPNTQMASNVEALSAQYGLPVILPLLDLTERVFINENDVMSDNLATLTQAAERYNTKTMLLGKMRHDAGTWYCEWRLVDGQVNIAWSTYGNDVNAELDAMFNKLADQLVIAKKQLKTPPAMQQGIIVRINGIKSVADYAKILEHLRGLPELRNVEIGSVDGSHATFRIIAEGGIDVVLKALQASNLLMTTTDVRTAVFSNSIDATYRINS